MDNILHHIRTGDIVSFHTAYHLYHAKLYFYALKNTRSRYLAEETVQLTFIKLWENKHMLSPDIDLSIQIFRVAKSTMIDLLRKEIRRLDHQAALAASTDGQSPERPDPAGKDDLRHIYDTIEKMAPVRKKVFRLSRLEGLSHKEIAEQLSISPKTVENHIGRAIRQLKDVLTLFF
ncbi:MAG: sigma-70 family RNA polymerase sigma factor [Chitinophagaceae bacterium]|nr:sigma-70 family RNA polymerase sigma factor [Chitinophagaceae bacterium]